MSHIDVECVEKQVGELKLRSRVLLPGKTSPGQRCEGRIRVQTNVFGIKPLEDVPFFRYDFRVLEEYPSKKQDEPVFKEVTKQTRNDYVSIERKNKCVAVYLMVMHQEANFFGDIGAFVYDRASTLYSLDKLKLADGEVKSFTVVARSLPKDLFSEDCLRVIVKVKQCAQEFQLSSMDLKSGFNLNPDLVSRSLQQFYELLLSQDAFFTEGRFVCYGSGENYLYNPLDFGFSAQETPGLPDGKYIGVGAIKGVKIVEGSQDRPTLSFSVDVKKAAFHIELQSIAEKVSDICNCPVGVRLDDRHVKMLSKMLKGLYVRCNYGKRRTFIISGISEQSVDSFKLEKDGKMIGMARYFMDKYKIALKFGKLPLVVEKTSRGTHYYPMELLFVCENQRVNLSQQSSRQVQQMIRACATVPSMRKRQMLDMVSALNLDQGGRKNRWCREFQVHLAERTYELEARVLQKPTIVYGGDGRVEMKESGAWTITQNTAYLLPSVCERWIIIALVSASDRFSRNDLENYTALFLERCRSRGISIRKPMEVIHIPRAREQDVDIAFKNAEKMSARFIHFVTSENLKYHEKIKFLESQYQILTQDLMTKNAAVIRKRPQTLDNIVHKTNLKLGGINFDLHLESEEAQKWIGRKDRLIIGMDLTFTGVPSKDKSSKSPSVIGYAMNCHAHPLDFTGGYRFCWTINEEVTFELFAHLCPGDKTFCDIVSESLQLAKKNRRVPVHLVILRDGVSEGQYKYAIEKEVQDVKDACARVGGAKYKPYITFVLATKRHQVRIYRSKIDPSRRAVDQNIPPGTVVDTEVVNPVYNEFYLNSHAAIQGTAKTPRYNVLYDNSSMSSDEVQGMVYALTFNMQIVNQPCSLPAPLIIADQMAARGRSNFIAFCGRSSSSVGSLDLDHINSELGYMGKELSNYRFNA
ncbi:unnamed protein product [Enterobius vermicularis]|uniref:PAZ domain-containing protein n=1 Tax=Enterobius vermicularis TaxID=51028 RepID=A0A0N4V2U5_ENTVE|nr:unnamed protein product [Enterobius vermicularis]